MTPAQRLQKSLIDYLNIDLDPYDLAFAIEEWAHEFDEVDLSHEDASPEDMNPRQLKEFTAWLMADKARWYEELVNDLGPQAPSYLFFYDAKPVPPGTWLVHLTNASPFTTFKYGTLMYELGLTRHFTDAKRRENEARCDRDPGEREPLFGFSFRADDRKWRMLFDGRGHKYGRNAVFFQHDTAVEAHHDGDNEQQVLFDICGAYNAVPVWNVQKHGGGGTIATDDGELELDSWEDIIAWAEEQSKPKKRRGLGGLQGHSRWAPGVRVPPGSFSGLLNRR